MRSFCLSLFPLEHRNDGWMDFFEVCSNLPKNFALPLLAETQRNLPMEFLRTSLCLVRCQNVERFYDPERGLVIGFM